MDVNPWACSFPMAGPLPASSFLMGGSRRRRLQRRARSPGAPPIPLRETSFLIGGPRQAKSPGAPPIPLPKTSFLIGGPCLQRLSRQAKSPGTPPSRLPTKGPFSGKVRFVEPFPLAQSVAHLTVATVTPTGTRRSCGIHWTRAQSGALDRGQADCCQESSPHP